MLQKLPTTHESAFFSKSFKSAQFNFPWHNHTELEIILISEGSGNCYVGNYTGKFTTGDIFFIGANVPHSFTCIDSGNSASAILVQFKADLLGENFIALPETTDISRLFEQAKSGIKVSETYKKYLSSKIKEIEHQSGFDRIITLFSCLNVLAKDNERMLLSTANILSMARYKQDRLEKVFKFIDQEFSRPITLKEVSDIAGMSIAVFCDYFKKTVKRTYIEFLNEVRLSFACKLLIESDMTISEIFYRCGYNTPANFNRQFLKYKGQSPSSYRKTFYAK